MKGCWCWNRHFCKFLLAGRRKIYVKERSAWKTVPSIQNINLGKRNNVTPFLSFKSQRCLVKDRTFRTLSMALNCAIVKNRTNTDQFVFNDRQTPLFCDVQISSDDYVTCFQWKSNELLFLKICLISGSCQQNCVFNHARPVGKVRDVPCRNTSTLRRFKKTWKSSITIYLK